MLKDLIANDFGEKENFNCAEKILYGANEIYDLGLNNQSLKLSAGFGGGMGIESVCGALTACVMVLSHKYVDNIGRESEHIKPLTQKLFQEFINEMQSIQCTYLKATYKNEETGCKYIILKAADILDRLMKE